MVQFRRLDPLANADRWTRVGKSPVKSFTMTQAQFLRLRERRPELVVTEDESCVVGFPYRDYLDIQYGFQEVADFRDRFTDLFTKITEASTKQEAPRGVVLSFRDRPNRALADPTFWGVMLEEGAQWVEMNSIAVPEQDEPADTIDGGYTVREAKAESDGAAVADLEAALSGLPKLSDAGLASIFENNRTVRIVGDASGAPVALLGVRRAPAASHAAAQVEHRLAAQQPGPPGPPQGLPGRHRGPQRAQGARLHARRDGSRLQALVGRHRGRPGQHRRASVPRHDDQVRRLEMRGSNWQLATSN